MIGVKRFRILDLASGSGAILIEALNQLHAASELSNARLEELRGQRTLSDLVSQAYALTPAEIALMWQTAPPGA